MKRSSWRSKLVWTAGLSYGVYLLWRREQRKVQATPALPPERAFTLLSRAAAFVRLPSSPDRPPEVLPDGSGLRCPATGRTYPLRDNILDLLTDRPSLSSVQEMLNTPFTSWLYDRLRNVSLPLLGLPDFATEVGMIQRQLRVVPGDVVLDLCCGPGNFTAEWAKRSGPEGLVLALDLSRPMLLRAAYRQHSLALDNVLFIRADAQHLPLADGGLSQVNCSGGFHQLPDLQQALREISRISQSSAVLTVATFARAPGRPWAEVKQWLKDSLGLHFVALDWLGERLAELGYSEYQWTLPGGWFAYAWARRQH